MTDEEYVRARWGDCTASYINCGMSSSYWSVRRESDGQELCREYCGALKGDDPAWSAARGFTEQREREIAEVEEEIAELESHILCYGNGSVEDERMICVYQRILAVEQARLAELRGGMKEGSE